MKALLLLAAILYSSISYTMDRKSTALNELRYSNSSIIKDSAIISLVDFASDIQVKNELSNIVENQFEELNVRVRAAQVLSRVATDRNVLTTLARAHDRSNNTSFRAEILRTLYKAVPTDQRLKDVMAYNLQNSSFVEIRKAAAFAMMKVSTDAKYKSILENVCLNQNEQAVVKVEALKSLLSNRSAGNYQTFLENIVNNRYENSLFREAAIRVMKATNSRSRAQGFINNLIRYESDISVKSQALRSMDLQLKEEDIRWLRPSTDPRSNGDRDPFHL